jgi:hypothetical protein
MQDTGCCVIRDFTLLKVFFTFNLRRGVLHLAEQNKMPIRGKEPAMMEVMKFEVGQKYKNRMGTYKVMAVDGDAMDIRWTKGKKVTTSVRLQSRVLVNIQREIAELAPLKAALRKKAAAAASI